MSHSEAFAEGCSLFVDECYEDAIEKFTEALKEKEDADCYIKRSACHFKLKALTDALADANSALKLDPSSSKAYFRKGIACFSLDEYETAKIAFEKGLALAQEKEKSSFKMWIRKCDAEISEQEPLEDMGGEDAKIEEMEVEEAQPAQEEKKEDLDTMNLEEEATNNGETTEVDKNPLGPPIRKEEEKVRHSFYQTADTITISFYVRDRQKKDVDIEIREDALEVNIELGDGACYVYDVALHAKVDPKECHQSINKANVEVRLKKEKPGQWPSIEKAGIYAPADPNDVKHVYPSSSRVKKDWDKIAASVADEKLEGEQALNKVFKDIYSGGSEEQRRAMIKSFTESGGTVLSTNWDEVGSKKVEGSAPKGMEMKSYND